MALIIENVSPANGIQAENVRTKVARFAVCMEQILKTKDAKYEGRQYDISQLIIHLLKEIKELEEEFTLVPGGAQFTNYRLERIMDEAIDVANMCMYVHDECAALMRFRIHNVAPGGVIPIVPTSATQSPGTSHEE
jgi:hypothetical protein